MRRASPTLAVVERIVNANGFDLDLSPRVEFTTHAGSCGERYVVPDGLWHLDHTEGFATVLLPEHLNWSSPSASITLNVESHLWPKAEDRTRSAAADLMATTAVVRALCGLWPVPERDSASHPRERPSLVSSGNAV